MGGKPTERQFILCIKNDDCDDLETRKIYEEISDEDAEKEGYVRVVDESGEDYLYPESYFIRIQLSQEAIDAIVTTA